MPSRLVETLVRYLDVWRLNWPWVRNGLIKGHYLEPYTVEEVDPYFYAGGYMTPMYGQNLTVIIFVLLLILLVWLFICLKDYYGARVIVKHGGLSEYKRKKVKHCLRSKHEPCCTNFIVRFLYLFFIEIALCTLLTIANVKRDSSASRFQWNTSIFVWVIIAIVLLWLCYLVWFPFNNYYADYIGSVFRNDVFKDFTVHSSWWHYRPL
jgi:hypothetical protein